MMMRTVMTLFVSVLTTFVPTTVAWAQEEEEEEGIVYYDPTAPEGQQMKRTVEYMELSEDLIEDNNVLEDGKWYYVDDYVWIDNRITVNGTVNIILGDGCTLEVRKASKYLKIKRSTSMHKVLVMTREVSLPLLEKEENTIRGVMQPLVEMVGMMVTMMA